MFRRRHLLLHLSAWCVTLNVACAPLSLISDDGGWKLASASALAAAGGNSGNSGGNSSGGAGGAGAGNGVGSGNGGGGSGNSGGNAGSGGAGNTGGGNNAGGIGSGQSGKGGAGGTASGQGSSISVEHSNGMKESILNGRYEMQDASGRTIVNRPASRSDRNRLERQRGNDPR